MSAPPIPDPGGVAIIALAGRFPGAATVDRFWSNLCAGVESIRRYTEDELDMLGVPREVRRHPRFVPAGALLEHVDRFDAALFGFTPREAEVLDPQHRLFFECVWEAIERAGYAPGSVEAPVGLFAGTSFSGYLLHNLLPEADAIRAVGVYQTYIANDKDSLTTYVSYKLNLRGPSVTLQTACSTSLVAVQFACQSLLGYQCDMALAGGVSLQMPHQPGYVYQEGAIASPDGHCRAFDAMAAGTVSGSGVGVVVLRRLEDALADGDQIVATIRGGAVNNDGSGKVGYTAPGADGQAEVIATAHALAGTPPDTIGYVEAHGTGTPLGDPIEIAALTRVFRARTRRTGFCALGSVKTNIGHLDAAAGVAGLIKAALAVERATIPASLHFEHPNPKSSLGSSPFYVPTRTTAWPSSQAPRRAAVSSFGIGGTNAHLVLEEAPAREASGPSRAAQILSLSARSAAGLEQLAQEVAGRLSEPGSPCLADAAFTLHVGRRPWPHRLSLTCRTADEAVLALRSALPTESSAACGRAIATRERPVAFLFPGQGAQYPGMGKRLYAREPVFRAEFDACADILGPLIGMDLRDLLVRAESAGSQARLNQTAVSQPAIFAVEHALARLWMSWGVRPDAMLGHSIGEYAAACVAGVISRDDALRLVSARGRLMQSLPRGSMLAVAASERELRELLSPDLSVAAVNAATSVVASGPVEGIEQLAGALTRRGLAHRLLETSHAFHSAMVTPILDEFASEVRAVRLSPPSIRYVSSVTGSWMSPESAVDPGYWVRHLRDTVMFDRGLATLLSDDVCVPLEVGPGRVLTGLVRQMPGSSGRPSAVASMPGRGDAAREEHAIAEAVSRLWIGGATIDWTAYYGGEQRRRVLMPTTPFERQRYWIEPSARHEAAGAPDVREARLDSWLYVPEWTPAPIDTTESATPETGDTPGLRAHVLVLGPALLAQRFSEYLRAEGHVARVVPVEAATDLRGDLARLFRTEIPHDVLLLRICCLWGITDGTNPPLPDEARRISFDLPLAVAQALADTNVSAPLTLLLAVNRLFGAVPQPFAPGRALVMGPALVIPQEHPNVTCRIVDLDVPGVGPSSPAWPSPPLEDDRWMRVMADEVTAADPDSRLVAYRGTGRYTRAFRRLSIDRALPRLTRSGVYWITGATGGIGRALADHLAATYRARLVLTARRAVPDACIASLEAAGGEVLTLSADVTDAGAMRRAAEAAVERFGRVDGIIHAAGVAGGGLLAFKTAASADTVLAPKVAGTLAVAAAAQQTGARFIALCSSLAAVQGGFGQIDYVAANAFMDSFAAWHTRTSGIFTVSIGWDGWRETGMALDTAADLRARASIAQRTQGALPHTEMFAGPQRAPGDTDGSPSAQDALEGLSTRDGIAVFERILAGAEAQVAVSTVPIDARIRQQRNATRVFTALAGSGRNGRAGREADLEGLSIEARIAELWARVLGVREIGADASFFDVGGDSLKGVQLMAHVNEQFGLELPVAQFFGAPTIGSLAALVRQSAGTDSSVTSADAGLDASLARGRLRNARRAARAST